MSFLLLRYILQFAFYKKTFRFTPAICKDCTVSRIQPGFLPTYEPWLIPTCESSNSHRQQTTFAAFRYVPRPTSLFFRAKRGIRGCFVGKNSVSNCIQTYVRNEFSALKRDVDPISPCIFSSQAGIQRSFLDVQSLTGLYTDIRSGRIVHSKTRYVPRPTEKTFQ